VIDVERELGESNVSSSIPLEKMWIITIVSNSVRVSKRAFKPVISTFFSSDHAHLLEQVIGLVHIWDKLEPESNLLKRVANVASGSTLSLLVDLLNVIFESICND